ncbi:hypothetical protein [Clostridium oryzae]|uniref:hypothetical protein n=1 Tax=Clostridium oryzae TaxID=1450648 RepID=UPI0009A4970E|nr:hypothetical protein [Clostridium oryzae]
MADLLIVISLVIGSCIAAFSSIALIIEFRQDRKLDFYYKNHRNSKMKLEEDIYECHDQVTRLRTARQEGIKEGMQEGIKEGATQKAINVARNLLIMGLEVNQVAEATELSMEKIIELKKEI